MSGGLYSNKFHVQLSTIARIVFTDERPVVGLEGEKTVPAMKHHQCEIVMTPSDFHDLLLLCAKLWQERYGGENGPKISG